MKILFNTIAVILFLGVIIVGYSAFKYSSPVMFIDYFVIVLCMILFGGCGYICLSLAKSS